MDQGHRSNFIATPDINAQLRATIANLTATPAMAILDTIREAFADIGAVQAGQARVTFLASTLAMESAVDRSAVLTEGELSQHDDPQIANRSRLDPQQAMMVRD
ncbi:hypothetical protein ABGB16_13900 [Micromonospora sp. B11E3]|uniref:hypothetical protein n=1 Tax=Micromonospora sp. B11E3 TaxID=3153562 RepID=UPI00325C8D6E